MSERKRISKMGEIAWLLGTILCSFGVHFSAKSGFGVSMVVAPSFVISNYLQPKIAFFSFGNTEYVMQGVVVLIIIAVVRKFKLKYLLSFVSAVLYGLLLDLWGLVFGGTVPTEMYLRIIYMVSGAIVTALAIALYLKSFMPQQSYDMFVYEIATEKKLNMNIFKWIYDAVSLVIGIVLMLILFGTFDFGLIGIGTLILTVINSPLIALFGKLLDKFFLFTPAFPTVAEKVFSYVVPEKQTQNNSAEIE